MYIETAKHSEEREIYGSCYTIHNITVHRLFAGLWRNHASCFAANIVQAQVLQTLGLFTLYIRDCRNCIHYQSGIWKHEPDLREQPGHVRTQASAI